MGADCVTEDEFMLQGGSIEGEVPPLCGTTPTDGELADTGGLWITEEFLFLPGWWWTLFAIMFTATLSWKVYKNFVSSP